MPSTTHISTFGVFADVNMRPDMDGLVHTTTEAVLRGRWALPDDDVAYHAPQLAQQNAGAVARATAHLQAWRLGL